MGRAEDRRADLDQILMVVTYELARVTRSLLDNQGCDLALYEGFIEELARLADRGRHLSEERTLAVGTGEKIKRAVQARQRTFRRNLEYRVNDVQSLLKWLLLNSEIKPWAE